MHIQTPPFMAQYSTTTRQREQTLTTTNNTNTFYPATMYNSIIHMYCKIIIQTHDAFIHGSKWPNISSERQPHTTLWYIMMCHVCVHHHGI